jgi:hypothetical protein
MELSLGGFLGAVAGAAIGAPNYVMLVPFVVRKLRALDKSETTAQRDEFEARISAMRRSILGIEVFTLAALGYWLGAKFLGPVFGE